MLISDQRSDVALPIARPRRNPPGKGSRHRNRANKAFRPARREPSNCHQGAGPPPCPTETSACANVAAQGGHRRHPGCGRQVFYLQKRSEEHTSELQSLMRISYAVFCLKKKKSESKHHEHAT